MRTQFRHALSLAALALCALAIPATAAASPPANDDLASATVIDPAALPFSVAADTTEATTESGEPSCMTPPATNTVWYSVTPASSGVLRVSVSNPFFTPLISVYRSTGPGFGGLSSIECTFYGPVAWNVQAGGTYYVQVGGLNGGAGPFTLSVDQLPPPANDDFAAAAAVGSLPFDDSVETVAATTEPDEPVTPNGAFTPIAASAWYSFTAATTQAVTVTANACCVTPILAVYSGSAFGNLTQVGGVSGFGQPVTFRAEAGTTYHFQLARAGLFNGASSAVLQIHVQATPPPTASFVYFPNDPSAFDTVQFIDQSNDPGGLGFATETWSFGDGTSASTPGCCPTHHYSSDGDYTVRLDVATTDGRTASQQQVVHVRTHDVTIAKVLVPQAATVGQTRTITVGLTNHRYPETVQLQLLKSIAGGGWQQVGNSTQLVPVRSGNRTTDFGFSYTFAPEDAQLGKVNFQAVATLQGAHDAVPSDNTFVSLPTKVNR